jgi:hypothetical protein
VVIRAFGVAVVGLMGLAGAARAVDTFAFTVEQVSQGLTNTGGPVASNRSNLAAPLGAPDGGALGTFYSLGFGGSMTLSFGGPFGGHVTVWEVTYGNIPEYPESVGVYVGAGATAGTATYWHVGDLLNLNSGTPMSLAAVGGVSGLTSYDYVRLVDISSPGAVPIGGDGFDLDAVGVGPVPTPGTAALLAAAGLIGPRRRRARV